MKIALYQPDIAQNLGTNLRTAACLGVDVEIIEPCGFPFDDRKIRRAGMDYIDMVKYNRHTCWEDFRKWSEQNNFRLVLLSSKVKTSYTDFVFQKNDILLLGRESAGVPDEVSKYCKHGVTIPMQENVRSLNVAVSAGIVLGEALRQTR
jgi:tRNA (cytidine/uridine-2'-O-)-methyltransferase